MMADDSRCADGQGPKAIGTPDYVDASMRPPLTDDEVNRLAFVRWRKTSGQMQAPVCPSETQQLCDGLMRSLHRPREAGPRWPAQPMGRWPLAHRP
jgi:hypothetical protein